MQTNIGYVCAGWQMSMSWIFNYEVHVLYLPRLNTVERFLSVVREPVHQCCVRHYVRVFKIKSPPSILPEQV